MGRDRFSHHNHTCLTQHHNQGIVNKNGTRLDLLACIYVDDALMLGTDRAHIEMVLAAAIEAIFVMMGKPNTGVRQCPLAMDKWSELVVGQTQTMLGLIIDTNKLTLSIPYKYLDKVLDLLNLTWLPTQCCFKESEAQKLTGKLAHLAEGANRVFHLLILNCLCTLQEKKTPDGITLQILRFR
jgi:hypothetical protein